MRARNEPVVQKGKSRMKRTESTSFAQVPKKTQPEEFDLVILGGASAEPRRS